jgi:hypothetical protein
MFSVTTKKDYWRWIGDGVASPKDHNLKEIQDAYVLSLLKQVQGKRILEAGGGISRTARLLAQKNEMWLIDGCEEKDGGPAKPPELPGVKIVVGYMGEFLKDLPDAYFDYVFSVSVVEHMKDPDYPSCFRDRCCGVCIGEICFQRYGDAARLESPGTQHERRQRKRSFVQSGNGACAT